MSIATVVRLQQTWSRRRFFRRHGSSRERRLGVFVYGVAIVLPVILASVDGFSATSPVFFVATPVFAWQATALLFVVPPWWNTVLAWIINRAAVGMFLAFCMALGAITIQRGVAGDNASMGASAMLLAITSRTMASMAEPTVAFMDKKTLHWRIQRATWIHSSFMVIFSFGTLVTLGSIVKSMHSTVPISVPVATSIATAAFVFKVHQRVRRTCTLLVQRIGRVQRLTADLGAGTADHDDIQEAILDLELALRTPLQTGHRTWGTPVVPPETRRALLGWLHKKSSEPGVPALSTDEEAAALEAIRAVCIQWADVAI